MLRRGVKSQPAESFEIDFGPGVRGQTGYEGRTVFIRFSDIAFDIPCGQADHPAQHRHGGREVGAVSFLGIQQEMGDEVKVGRLGFHIQRIAEVPRQPGLNGQRAVIRRGSDGSRFAGQGVDRFFQVAWQGGIGFNHLLIPAVFQRRTDLDQGAQAGVAGQEERSRYGIGIAGPQIPGDKQFGGIGEIGDQFPARNQVADALGNEERGSAVIEHPYGYGNGIAQGVPDRLSRQVLVEQDGALSGQPGRLAKVPPAAGGVFPVAAGVQVEHNAAQVRGPQCGNLHHRRFIRIGFAAELFLTLGIIPFRGEGEHVPGFGEEQPVEHRLAQFVCLIPERIGPHPAGGQQESAGHQQRRDGQQRQQRRFRETVRHQHQQQRQQRGQEPGNGFRCAGQINQQDHAETQQRRRQDRYVLQTGETADQRNQDGKQDDGGRGHQRQRGPDAGKAQRYRQHHIRNCDHPAQAEYPYQQGRQAQAGGNQGRYPVDGRELKQDNDSRAPEQHRRGQEGRLQDAQERQQQAGCQQHGQQRVGQAGSDLLAHGGDLLP